MRLSHLRSAQLCKEEVIALRLYTGPMYIKYNAVLRGYPQSELRALKGNRYTTTIHAVVSGLLKLQKVTIVPSTHKVGRSRFSPWPGYHREQRMLQTMLVLMTMHASWTCILGCRLSRHDKLRRENTIARSSVSRESCALPRLKPPNPKP